MILYNVLFTFDSFFLSNNFHTEADHFRLTHIFVLVLGEPTFRSLADMETPTGVTTDSSASSSSSTAEDVPVDTDAVLSSTAINGSSSIQPETLDLSNIESEVLFCQKCGQVFQK